MSVVKGVEACVVVERGWCVCWWMLFGPSMWRERFGRLNCVVVDVGVCVV